MSECVWCASVSCLALLLRRRRRRRRLPTTAQSHSLGNTTSTATTATTAATTTPRAEAPTGISGKAAATQERQPSVNSLPGGLAKVLLVSLPLLFLLTRLKRRWTRVTLPGVITPTIQLSLQPYPPIITYYYCYSNHNNNHHHYYYYTTSTAPWC